MNVHLNFLHVNFPYKPKNQMYIFAPTHKRVDCAIVVHFGNTKCKLMTLMSYSLYIHFDTFHVFGLFSHHCLDMLNHLLCKNHFIPLTHCLSCPLLFSTEIKTGNFHQPLSPLSFSLMILYIDEYWQSPSVSLSSTTSHNALSTTTTKQISTKPTLVLHYSLCMIPIFITLI